MSVKTINIKIPKIDYQIIDINLTENEQSTQLGENDILYFTVSNSPDTTNYKIQKSVGNGITYNQETGKYELILTIDDTKDLILNHPYGYDITIYYDGDKPRQKVIGTFTVTNKFTMNEVVSNG